MTAAQDPLIRAARCVGDFANPFYAEERQRDVWNEASAFGLQLLLATGLLAATVTVWTVGAPSVPYVQGAVLLLGAVSLLTIAYAQRLGVDPTTGQRLLRLRMLPFAAVVVLLTVGLLRAGDTELSWSTAAGAVTGAAVAGGALLLANRLLRRANDPEAE